MDGGIMISIISSILAAAAFINAYTFPSGTSDGVPGAGVFPQVICAIIIFINLILIWRGLRGRKEPVNLAGREGWMRFGALIILTAIMLAAWEYLHFCILCSLYLMGIGWILKQKMKMFIPGAIISSVCIYFIFHQMLNVML